MDTNIVEQPAAEVEEQPKKKVYYTEAVRRAQLKQYHKRKHQRIRDLLTEHEFDDRCINVIIDLVDKHKINGL